MRRFPGIRSSATLGHHAARHAPLSAASVTSFAWLADSSVLLVGLVDGNVALCRAWDLGEIGDGMLSRARCVATHRLADAVRTLAWSASGRRLAAASDRCPAPYPAHGRATPSRPRTTPRSRRRSRRRYATDVAYPAVAVGRDDSVSRWTSSRGLAASAARAPSGVRHVAKVAGRLGRRVGAAPPEPLSSVVDVSELLELDEDPLDEPSSTVVIPGVVVNADESAVGA